MQDLRLQGCCSEGEVGEAGAAGGKQGRLGLLSPACPGMCSPLGCLQTPLLTSVDFCIHLGSAALPAPSAFPPPPSSCVCGSTELPIPDRHSRATGYCHSYSVVCCLKWLSIAHLVDTIKKRKCFKIDSKLSFRIEYILTKSLHHGWRDSYATKKRGGSSKVVCACVIPVIGRWRQADFWCWLSTGQILSERTCL